MSLNVGGGVRIRPGKLYKARKNTSYSTRRTHGAGCAWPWCRTAETLGERRCENWITTYFSLIWKEIKINWPDTQQVTNGLIRLIRIESSIGINGLISEMSLSWPNCIYMKKLVCAGAPGGLGLHFLKGVNLARFLSLEISNYCTKYIRRRLSSKPMAWLPGTCSTKKHIFFFSSFFLLKTYCLLLFSSSSSPFFFFFSFLLLLLSSSSSSSSFYYHSNYSIFISILKFSTK